MITQIVEVCLIPLLGILTKYLVDFLNAKCLELKTSTDDQIAQKYIEMINDTVITCVVATNQTYVNALKQSGSFDKEAQQKAFQMTLDAILTILSEDAKQYIVEVSGDITTYLTQLIEKQVNYNKQETK